MKHLGFIKSGKDIVIVEYLESVVSALSDGVAEDIKNASDELKRLISSIPKFEIKVVDALPTENISTSTVYLLRATKTTTQDIFEEYVYAKDGEVYKWERLGSQKIDFSNYYQKSETYNKSEVDALIQAVKDYFDNGVAKEAAKVSNALTIKKGSTTTTYDGSEPKSVEIPALGETDGTAYEGSKGKANATNIATLLSYFVEGVAKVAAKLSHKITFKGGVVGTFDGSEDKEVTIPSALSDLTPDATHRTVTDTEKADWNAKYDKPSGGIPNSDLSHSTMTIAGNNVALGGSISADTIVGAASASAQFAGTAAKAAAALIATNAVKSENDSEGNPIHTTYETKTDSDNKEVTSATFDATKLTLTKRGGGKVEVDVPTLNQNTTGKAATAGLADEAKNLTEDAPTIVDETFTTKTLTEQNEVVEVQRLKGNSVVWNQLVNPSRYNGTFVGGWINSSWFQITVGHKYILGFKGNQNVDYFDIAKSGGVVLRGYNLGSANTFYGVFDAEETTAAYVRVWMNGDYDVTYVSHDLTQMFGAGNEPATYEEFLSRKPKVADEFAYDEGSIVNFKADMIESKGGINIWDEQWELGNIDGGSGVNTSYDGSIRSKNYIKLDRGINYYAKAPLYLNARWYDIDKNYLGYSVIQANSAITVYNNAAFLRFVLLDTQYNHDICINISDPAINGNYFPYESVNSRIDVTKLRSKAGELIFPDGMKKAGNVCDEIVGRKAIKRIGVRVFDGTEEWRHLGTAMGVNMISYGIPRATDNVIALGYSFKSSTWVLTPEQMSVNDYFFGVGVESSDISAWKSHLAELYAQGNPLTVIYDLAEPIEYELEDALTIALPALQGSTLEVVGENTAPLNATMAYYKNARKVMRDLIGAMSNYMSRQRDEVVNGIKDFINGIKVAGHAIWYDAAANSLMIDGNVAATGGVSSGGIQQARSTRGATGFVAEIDATANVPVSIENEVGTTNIVVSVYDRTNNAMVLADVVISPTQITVTTTQTKQLKVVVIGL